MKKFSEIIVGRHKIVLAFMVILCVATALLIPSVEINTDMTKYLPDDSSMKKGVDVMMEDFEAMAMSQTIRVMFENLSEEDIANIKNQLESIEYVDSVSYVAGSEDYNKDNYTKFVVNTSYTYDSPEELSIEKAIEETKETYYDVLEESSEHWHEDTNDNTAFIKYILGIILSAYRDFEDRLNLIEDKISAYEMVERVVKNQLGKFTKSDIQEYCPTLARQTIEKVLKQLCDEGKIEKHGQASKTFYTRKTI